MPKTFQIAMKDGTVHVCDDNFTDQLDKFRLGYGMPSGERIWGVHHAGNARVIAGKPVGGVVFAALRNNSTLLQDSFGMIVPLTTDGDDLSYCDLETIDLERTSALNGGELPKNLGVSA